MIYRSRLDVLFCAPCLAGLHFVDLLNREVHKKKELEIKALAAQLAAAEARAAPELVPGS